MRGITERIASGTAQRSSYSCKYSERQIQEVRNGVGNLAQNISALSRSFYERFPVRPEGLVRRVVQFISFWYPLALFVALLFFVVAMTLHWPFFFRWFGYHLSQMTVAKDVRDVFLIP